MKRITILLFFFMTFTLAGCEADDFDETIIEAPSVSDQLDDGENTADENDLIDKGGLEEIEETLGVRPPIYQGMTLEGASNPTLKNLRDRTVFLNVRRMSSFYLSSNNEDVEFFSNPNEEVLVSVRLINPDGQSILRLTLNNVVYQTFQFQEGSDSETIIIKIISGDIPGINELTIDEIKYVENNTNLIKDVIFDGERTIRYGVTYQEIPTSELLNIEVSLNDVTLEFNIEDKVGLIDSEEPVVLFELLNEGEIVKSTELELGTQIVLLEALKLNQNYTFKVSVEFDRIDGLGRRFVTLNEGSFETPNLISINSVISSSNAAIVSFSLSDSGIQTTFSAVNLYLGDTRVDSFDRIEDVQFENLFSNREYRIEVVYEYEINQQANYLKTSTTFKTDAMSVPELAIKSLNTSQTSMAFEFVITDPGMTGEVSSINVYLGSNITQTITDLQNRQIERLNANQNYVFEVVFTYDLNDGLGPQSIVLRENFKTSRYQEPQISINSVTPLRESISFILIIDDQDQVGAIQKIEILKNNEIIQTVTGSAQNISGILELSLDELAVFDGKEGRKAYIAVSGIIYDVTDSPRWQDGIHNGDPSIAAGNDLTQQIQSISPHGDRVLDNIPIVGRIVTDGARTISNLQSNTDYRIRVTYIYDLKEGQGEQTLTVESSFKTLSSRSPIISISATSIGYTDIEFSVDVTDEDALGQITKIKLLLGDEEVNELNNSSVQQFSNLRSNTHYTITVIYEYDLNQGEGSQTIARSYTFKTLAYSVPIVSYSAIQLTTTGIQFTLEFNDPYELIEDYVVELWLNDERLATKENQITGHFDGLLSGTDYQLKIVYRYNLNDGLTSVTEILETSIRTLQKSVPNITLLNTEAASESLSFEISFNDPDQIGTLRAIRLLREGELVSNLPLLNILEAGGLLSNTTYQVEIDITYQFNHNENVLKKTHIFTFQTSSKVIPKISTENISAEKTTLNFDLVIEDPDNVGGLDRIELFIGVSPVGVFSSFSDFTEHELSPSTSYRVRFVYRYDLNDGQGINELATQFIRQTRLMNGSGTEEDPYQVETPTDLQNVIIERSAYYILMNDLDLSGINWNPIGHHLNYFRGQLDGQGHTISNLYINQDAEGKGLSLGLFGQLTVGASVRNLIISGAMIQANVITDDHNNVLIGILAGQSFGEFENIRVSGNIISNVTGGLIYPVNSEIGGLFGRSSRSEMNRIHASVNITANSIGTAYSHINIGGIIGVQSTSTLSNAYSEGSLYGHSAGATAKVGGITGHPYSVIRNSFSKANVTAKTSVNHGNSVAWPGALIGSADYKCKYLKFYWYRDS